MHETATLYGVSEQTMYRLLGQQGKPRAVTKRSDRGTPRVLPKAHLDRYLELIAAVKLRTSNRKGRHMSTREAIRLLEDYGLETAEGFVQAPHGVLKTATVNRYLKKWGLDWRTLRREPPAVRFQADHSNELWQFDISPSDLKQLKTPAWIDEAKGQPTLMLYSVVDDCSGVAYQEYHCTYGESVEAALQFLFHAMTPKTDAHFPFCGRPACLYTDNGPVARSRVFQQVMRYLNIEVRTHLPRDADGRHTTARAKGKPDPFHELTFPSALDAKRAIADHLGMPLAKLSPDQLATLNALLAETLAKTLVWDHVRRHLAPFYRGKTMLSDVMEHFGLTKSLRQVDDFETEHHRQLLTDLKVAIHEGGIIAVTGIVGSGKTVLLGRMQEQLRQEG